MAARLSNLFILALMLGGIVGIIALTIAFPLPVIAFALLVGMRII